MILFAVTGIMKCDIKSYTKEALPFILTVIAQIGLMIFWPDMVLVIPNWIFGAG